MRVNTLPHHAGSKDRVRGTATGSVVDDLVLDFLEPFFLVLVGDLFAFRFAFLPGGDGLTAFLAVVLGVELPLVAGVLLALASVDKALLLEILLTSLDKLREDVPDEIDACDEKYGDDDFKDLGERRSEDEEEEDVLPFMFMLISLLQ